MTNNKHPRYKAKTDPDQTPSGHKNRRQLIIGGAAVGAALPFLPGSWTRPVVQSVFLPAHAQTSPNGECEVQLPDCNGDCQSPRDYMLYTFTCDGDCVEFDVQDSDASPGSNQVRIECGPEADQLISATITFADDDDSTRLVNSCGDADSITSDTANGFIELECGSFAVSATLTATSGGDAGGTASVTEITVVPA